MAILRKTYGEFGVVEHWNGWDLILKRVFSWQRCVTMTHGGFYRQIFMVCLCVCVCLAFFGHETMCVYLFKPGVFFHVLGVLKTCFFHHQTDGLKHCALGGPRNPWLTGHCRKELYQPVPFARLPSCFQMDLYDSQRCLKPPHLFKFHGSNEYQTSMPQS